MKIAYDARMIHGSYSGIGHYSLNLLRSLTKIDKDNEYLVIVRDKSTPQLFKGLGIIYFEAAPLSFSTLWQLERVISNRGIDVFHSPFHICPLNLKIKTLVTIHDLMPLLVPNYFQGRNLFVRLYAQKFINFAMLRSLDKADVIISDSHNTQRDILIFKPDSADKIKTCYPSASLNGCSSLEIGEEKGMGRKGKLGPRPIILTVGQARPQKNWFRLISSFKQFRERKSTGTLVLTASDNRNLNSLKRVIEVSELLSKSVKILGYQSEEALTELYHSADLFVFPSMYEGFGMPPLEAMSYGIPVVASNTGALPEVLGDAAYYVNPESVEDIASGMQKVLEESELRKRLIRKGYEQVKKYSWEKTAKQILDIYSKVYDESRK